ncbi:HDOD domain-containing protein [Sulfurimonas sp.]|jgi:HD-like signal output (HDOD) protein|uniref:HDOD domain-containing protein n=1 Tax=Sulfurimonas sp. TaxID=2022749 RepID=UPI0025D595BF|nr:HDOD domain-containing protein [Sulfurimonas sp.]MBT5935453.1 HDOD domain-containing protein [Sulfurimonas sp.]
MKSSIIDSIKSLPPLSKTIMDINRIYADVESVINDLAKVIAPDPMIVTNLLKTANSPLYGFGKEIKNVVQAVSLFGMSMTRTIALGNSARKLLNVDMKAYGVTSDDFANVSEKQAKLILNWYSKVDKTKAEDLYLAAFLQEMGKILISNDIIQEDEDTSFKSEIDMTMNIAQVEREYAEVSSSEVTAEVFAHWGFGEQFVEMIRYADNPDEAPAEIKEYSVALNIVKTALPINKPFSDHAINFALTKARDAGLNHELLEDVIDDMLDIIEDENE